MLDAYPRTQLCLMLEQYGQIIMTEPKRCKSILSDLAPEHRLETNLIIFALEQKIAAQLIKPSTLTPIELQLDRLAQSLHDAVGIEQELAYWAVESWALALNVIQQPIVKPNVPPESTLLLSMPDRPEPTQRLSRSSLIVFFVVSIFVIGALVFVAKTKHENKPLKQASAKQQTVVELQKNTDTIENPQIYLSHPETQDAWTQNNLGDIYYYGYGVTSNYQTAVQWYQKAAEQGEATGQCNLGFMYAQGYGIKKDYAKAADWYRKAAEQGSADGQNSLGILYENGYGVAKDKQKSIEWYSKAVEQGHYGAQQNLKRLLGKT